MIKYDFDSLIDRKQTYTAKWEKLPKGNDPDALSLWVADMDFPCAEPIIKALHDRVDRKVFGYTLYDNEDLKTAVVNWFKKRYDWTVPAENIFYCPGVVPAVAFLINILSEEGDGIITQNPVYYPFGMKIKASNREVVNSSLLYDNGRYTMDYDDLEKKFADPKNKGIILCSPHNPVGRVWTENELRKLVNIAKKYSKWIISDEIHADLIRKNIKFVTLENVAPDYKDEIITLTAPSKTFNLAGLKMSNIVINKKEYQNAYAEITGDRFSIASASPLGIAAVIAAYNEGEEWLEQVNDYIDANVDLCMEFFKKELPKSIPVYIEGTYLFWVDLRGYYTDHKKLEEIMQRKAKVALDEGYIFGEEGIGFERINLAAPKFIIEDCINRMKVAVLGSL